MRINCAISSCRNDMVWYVISDAKEVLGGVEIDFIANYKK